MTIAHLLESFDGLQDGGRPVSLSEDSLEDQKLESFERGYKAGWDDAVKAQADDTKRVTSDFASNLQDLSFTYNEAYGHILKTLKPLLQQVVDTVLPEIARKSLGQQICEQLTEMASGTAQQEVEIVVSPSNAGALTSMIEADAGFPVSVVEEPSLGEGQVYLRFGQSERQIDNDEVLSGITKAVAAFFDEIEQAMEKEA